MRRLRAREFGSLRLSSFAQRTLAEYDGIMGVVDSVLAEGAVDEARIDMSGHFAFADIQPGTYFLYGEQPRPAIEQTPTHWWVAVTLEPDAARVRNLGGNDYEAWLYCGQL